MNLIILELAKWLIILFLLFFLFFFVILRIIRHYYHFPIPSFLTKLIDNPIRRKLIQNPTTIANRMQLQAGMTVVEIGPGKGNYTKAIAKQILPNGKVIAIDIQESIIKVLKKTLEKEKILNIEPRIDNAHNLSIPSESVDRIIAITCLPEIPNPIQVLIECKRILKTNGLVCLCELVFDPDYPRRATEKKWAQEAGLKLENEFGNFFSYQLNFIKLEN
jgi:ubiquinone/menaquinone biosynthesis C-methylase UbiE